MNVSLSAEMEKFVAEKVRTGQCASADEAVNGLLSMLKEQEALSPEDVADLRAELDPAVTEADRGEFVAFSAEDVIAQGRAVLAARRKGT